MATHHREVNNLKRIRLKIWQSTEGMWLINVNGISVASSHFEIVVRDLVEKVVELNPDVEFEVVD